jgi:hypothetical protein
MPAGAKASGWHRLPGNGALGLYVNGTLIGSITATNLGLPLAPALALTATTTVEAGTSIAATTELIATTTLTAGTGLTVTTGNHTNSAGDHLVTAGNVRLGAVETFVTTQPTSAYVMKVGTNAAGAIAESGGIFVTTGGATLSKIIADGTVSQIEA